MENQEQSPVFKKKHNPVMTFNEALDCLLQGLKVTRLEWPEGDFAFMGLDNTLMLNIKGRPFIWNIHRLDMEATDWIVTGEEVKNV